MKNLLKVALLATAVFAAVQGYAQEQQKPTVGQQIDKSAKKVGHKTSELAAKGAAAVVDKKYDGKAGPNGEIVYINDKAQYYYVNKAGHRVYLKKSELRDKPIQ